MTDPRLLTSWHDDWSDLRVVVLGAGLAGFSVADTLVELGASVLVLAEDAPEERADLLTVIGAEFDRLADAAAIPARLIEFAPQLVVVSPGFRPDHALPAWAGAAGIPVWGDIELAWRVRDKVRAGEWLAVTGTRGSTTTAELTTHFLVAAGHRVVTVGDNDVPVLDAVRDPIGFDAIVLDLSSAQLHWLASSSLSPLASVCLNVGVAPQDLAEWHGDAAAYAAVLGRVYENTRVACVYNKSDPATQQLVENADVIEGCRAVGFDFGTPGPSDLGMVGDVIVDRAFHDDRRNSALELTTHGELAEAGLAEPHSVANVLAASALVRAFGVAPEVIRVSLATFGR